MLVTWTKFLPVSVMSNTSNGYTSYSTVIKHKPTYLSYVVLVMVLNICWKLLTCSKQMFVQLADSCDLFCDRYHDATEWNRNRNQERDWHVTVVYCYSDSSAFWCSASVGYYSLLSYFCITFNFRFVLTAPVCKQWPELKLRNTSCEALSADTSG